MEKLLFGGKDLPRHLSCHGHCLYILSSSATNKIMVLAVVFFNANKGFLIEIEQSNKTMSRSQQQISSKLIGQHSINIGNVFKIILKNPKITVLIFRCLHPSPSKPRLSFYHKIFLKRKKSIISILTALQLHYCKTAFNFILVTKVTSKNCNISRGGSVFFQVDKKKNGGNDFAFG